MLVITRNQAKKQRIMKIVNVCKSCEISDYQRQMGVNNGKRKRVSLA